MKNVAPVSLASFPENWISDRREVILRDGYAVRAGNGASIEIKSLTTNEWMRLALPGGATAFTSIAERNRVLGELNGASAA
jgi:hypothetical protein